MPWTTRPLTDSERVALLAVASSAPARSGCVSLFAYYGLFIILIPMVGGGFLGSVLKLFTIPENPAYLIGVSVALACSTGLFVATHRLERRQQARSHQRRELIAALSEVPVLELSLTRLWAIESEPDWPAYLLQGDDGSYLLLSTDRLQFLEPPFAHRQISLALLPPDNEQIVSLDWAGDSLAEETLQLRTPHDEWPGRGEATLLTFQQLPSEWQRLLIAV